MTPPRGMLVTPRLLQAVLRSFADLGPPESDEELLRRFLQNDQQAFAELVRRHGRLVWAVCLNSTHSEADAEDAFQATFLVLLQNAKKIRKAGKLSTWLYGVAHKVCANARRGAQRRSVRERANSTPERNGDSIPESAWDRALAVVHEEVAKLPETLRVPFIMCCIEGRGVSDAAEQVGCKLGTFSSRLTRAKDAILARLDERGLTLGVAAAVGLTSPTADALAKTIAIAQSGFVVPSSILQLSQGVIGMSIKSVKMLMAAVVLTCGLGVGLGSKWATTADAQQPAPKPPATKAELEAQVLKLQVELEQLQLQEALRAALGAKLQKEQPTFKTTKWEYDLVVVSDMDQTKFKTFLQDRENRGWEYNGTTVLMDGEKQTVWLFRRPHSAAAAESRKDVFGMLQDFTSKAKTAAAPAVNPPKEIGRLVYHNADLPLEPAEIADLLRKLAEKKFKPKQISIDVIPNGISVVGEKEAIAWADGLIRKLNER